MKKSHLVILVVVGVVLIDQILKVYIKTTFAYEEEHLILGLEWARLKFIENPGMAFGMNFGGEIGKLILSLFRILAVILLGFILRSMIKDGVRTGVLVCFALILAGALGNSIDGAIYGMIFSGSYHGVAELFPEGGGYAPFLKGRVVDMFYFPMIDTYFPDGLPLVGGNRFQFFRPIFNVADVSISTGVIALIVLYRSFFRSGASKGTQVPGNQQSIS